MIIRHFFLVERPRTRLYLHKESQVAIYKGSKYTRIKEPNICKPNIFLFFRSDTFLIPFVKEAIQLMEEGVTWTDSNGNQRRSRVRFLLLIADAIAKAFLALMMQFNGLYGFVYCLHEGMVVRKGMRIVLHGFKSFRLHKITFFIVPN